MARSEPASAHGWFPDPEDPERLRMWDGKGWTSLTKYPARDEQAASGPAPAGPVPHKPTPQEPAASAPAPRRPSPHGAIPAAPTGQRASFPAANLYSLMTLGVAVIYIVIASAFGWTFVGVLPVLLAVTAFREREPMAPFAGLGAAAAVVIGLVLLAR